MGLVKKTCYTIRCDFDGCDKFSYTLEDYIGPLDSLTTSPDIAESMAKDKGFIQISARKWLCPNCARKLGYKVNGEA